MPKLEEIVQQIREEALEQGAQLIPESFQGVTKERITTVLESISRSTQDIRDVVFALLDDEHQSFFRLVSEKVPEDFRFCDGATTAHIACHFGIWQRGEGKSDREGRDYWLKPLWEIGAIDKVFWDSKKKEFIPGHPKAKSPNNCYQLSEEFVSILKAPDQKWKEQLDSWIQEDRIRQRLKMQARLEQKSRQRVDTGHDDLIKASWQYYAPHFLSGYEVIYIDDSDGDRITEEEQAKLTQAGIEIELADSMPDVLLWHPETDWIWVIEAVTSDGEVDQHKVDNLNRLAERHGKAGVGFTTTYQTWKAAAQRQGKYKNIAPDTYIWIEEDPSKHFLAATFET